LQRFDMPVKPAIHLTYCTNVHALGDWAAWRDMIGYFGPAIRERLGWASLPMGLWFPSALIAELDKTPETSRERIRDLLAERGLSTFTFNAFPFGNFHDKVVKTKVYHPDWTDPRRLEYTVTCALLLAFLIPPGATGSVSTLPLGWRVGWSERHSRAAAKQLVAFVRAAAEIADREGRTIRLALEPEPGCALETSGQVIDFWERFLRPEAKAQGVPQEQLDMFCGVCYDTCHQAVQYEEPEAVLDAWAANGIGVAKMQLSSALEFSPDPARASEALRREFTEERFLHQTRARTPAGITSFDDLPEALASEGGLWAHPWRVHFHVPIDARDLLDPARVSTTQGDMLRAFRHALAKDLCRHFEVETYTWSVLPKAHRPSSPSDLADSIAREIRFAAAQLPPGAAPNA
jgi:sugar phosphate isomerase/epimerase